MQYFSVFFKCGFNIVIRNFFGFEKILRFPSRVYVKNAFEPSNVNPAVFPKSNLKFDKLSKSTNLL